MLFSKKRAKRFLAILLAAMLVFANDSALTAVALTAAEGEEIVNDANINSIEQYEEELQEESQEELQEELQEESQEELQEESQEELQEESQEEISEESQEELQEESQEEISEESQEELQEESQEEISEESQEELQEESQEELSEESQEEIQDEFQEENPKEELLDGDLILFNAGTLSMGMGGFMLTSVAPPEDFDNFGPTEECPTVVCLWTNFDRRDGDAFPVSVADVTEENVIDGGDMFKARAAGTSVTLTWTAETRPTQICIDLGEGNWDIREIAEDATSETIDITGSDNWYIEVKYGNDFDNFGPTEECPTVVCLWTNFDRRDGDAFPVSVADVTEENVIDGGDMFKARVAGTSVTLTWTAETRPTQICIDPGEGNWDIRDVAEDATSETIDIMGSDNWYIEVKYGNDFDNFGPTEECPTVVCLWTNFDRRDGDAFPVSVADVTEENVIDGGDMFKARVAGTSVTLTWTAETRPTQICIDLGEGNWDIRDVAEDATSENIDISGNDFWYIEVKYGNDFDNFGPTEECPTVVCLWTNFDRRDGDAFPVSVADVTEENVIDGGDMFKARVAGTSVTLTWPEETRPTQICIDLGEGNWDIRDVAEDATSENIDITGSDNWYIEVKYGNGGQGGGNDHIIGVDFLNDLSALPGDDTSRLCLELVGRQSDNGIIYLDSNTDRWEFGKGSDGQHMFNLSVPDNAVSLGFRLSTGGKAVKEAFYVIGEDKHNLTETEIADLTSDSYFNIRVNDGENWVELIVFSIVLEEGNQPGGGGGNDYDVTYSENTRISEDLSKNDITVDNNVTLTIDNCKVQINHKLTVKSGANVVGTSADSVLEITGKGQSEGITLYRTNGDVLTIGTSFGNDLDEPIDFRWNTTLNRWETEQNPFSGYDLPWYTISYGNSANLTTENGQVYAIRVHVGDITYSSISSEYNASETDKIYSMEDTIFHQKTQEEENDPEYQDTLMRFGIGGSDGDIMFKSELSGASIDFKFIPDFGYQLENIYTNENNGMLDEFAAAETISTFTFNVVQGKNVHFEVKFVEANNTVNGNAGISSQATIDSSNAASSGALEMTVNTGTPNSNIPQGSEALAAYDITLKNVVSKGEGRGNWETALTDLGSNSATVTLPVSDTTNYTYTVIREHDGQTETLEATITDGGISFETNKFSTYTIVKRPVAASIATATVTLGDALTYNGTLQTQSVASVKLGELTLNASTDYEITDASETDAGTYTLTITGKGDYKGTVTKQFTIAKAELTPSIAGTVTKAYDGNKEVNDASSLSVSLAGKCGSDDVSATVAKYEYDSADVGTGKTITATGIALSGTKAVNYELTSTTATATVGEVTKVTPEITLTGLQETTLSPVGVKGVLTPPDENANVIVEYKVIKTESVSGEDPEYEWTTTRPVTPGTYDVRATLPEATDNLNAVTTPVTGTYKLTQYVAPAPGENNNETESAETETKEETIEVETKTSAGNAVTAEPDIIEAEPLVSAEEPLIVPAENIEAEMPEGISEEAKEELVEQVAETVSELVEAILDGDEAVENAVSEETLENIKTALDEGKTIIAVVKVEVVDESSIPSEDKASIEKVLENQEENNINIACYLDLSIMLKTTDGEELGTYNELTGMVSFTIEAPEDMTCSEGQEYVVIRIHNGESTIIPVTVNLDGTLTFETDRFSSYALAIRDVVKEAESVSLQTETKVSDSSTESAYTKSDITEVADTKVNFWVYALIALGVLLIAVGIIFGIKKVKSE